LAFSLGIWRLKNEAKFIPCMVTFDEIYAIKLDKAEKGWIWLLHGELVFWIS
jgi:hypothetical protein